MTAFVLHLTLLAQLSPCPADLTPGWKDITAVEKRDRSLPCPAQSSAPPATPLAESRDERVQMKRELEALDASRPSARWFIGSSLLMGAGAVTALTGLVLWSAAEHWLWACWSFFGCGGRPSNTDATAGHVALGVGVGVILAGLVWTVALVGARAEGPTQRQMAELEQRLDVLEEARGPPPEVRERIASLQHERPSSGLPITLMMLGIPATLLGVSLTAKYLSDWDRPPAALIGALIGFVSAAALEGFGIWVAVKRAPRQREIDAEIRQLENGPPAEPLIAPPPVESRLPAAPIVLQYAWSF